jgi:hypothetical protein
MPLILDFVLPYLKLLAFVLLTGNFRDLSLFTAGSSCKNCPSARNASAANPVFKDIYTFIKHLVSLHYILK